MQDLESRRKQRAEREEERLASGKAIDPRPSDHGGEAQDDSTYQNLGDGTGENANAGANGALGSREEGTAGSASWPTAKPASAQPKAANTGKSKDPTA